MTTGMQAAREYFAQASVMRDVLIEQLEDARDEYRESAAYLRGTVVMAVNDAGLSQRAAAEAAGVALTTVNRWVRADRDRRQDDLDDSLPPVRGA